MKVVLMSLAGMVILSQAAPAPKADPKAFFLPVGSVALPALTGSALVDGLLLGKVAFLKAAILANLLLNQEDEEPADSYGPPAVDSYGAPAVAYEEPAPSYHEPAPTYQEPAPAYQEVDTYGAPVSDPSVFLRTSRSGANVNFNGGMQTGQSTIFHFLSMKIVVGPSKIVEIYIFSASVVQLSSRCQLQCTWMNRII